MNDRGWILVEVEGDVYTHAAPTGSRDTLCGRAVSFPMGNGEPSCPQCRVAVGGSTLADRLEAQYRHQGP